MTLDEYHAVEELVAPLLAEVKRLVEVLAQVRKAVERVADATERLGDHR